METILLVFKRKPQARKAVNFGSCPEEKGKEPRVSHGRSARSPMAKGVSFRARVKGPESRESDLRLSEPLRVRPTRAPDFAGTRSWEGKAGYLTKTILIPPPL